MSNKPTLKYFKLRGLGQFPRVVLEYLGIDYNNEYVQKIEDKERGQLKFGQLPIFIDTNGFTLTQSWAISKYIAKKHNFVGKTAEEEAIVDETVSAVHIDIITLFIRIFRGTEDKQKIIDVIIPRFFGKWESILAEKKYIAGGDSYTLADLYVYVAYEYTEFMGFGEFLKGSFPQLDALRAYFESNKGVAEYIKNRPVTDRIV